MIDWTPYLKSISDSEKYAQWETFYTLTDVEGKTRPAKTAPLLRDLWVQTIEKEPQNRQERPERPEKPERFTVLDGLRKYATNHVLLKGRPGSGKSTALARLLLEESVGAQSLRLNQQNQAKIIQIPILIELRLYETSILDLILQFLKRHKLIIDSNTLESWLLENQNFRPLLLFDGINELPSDTARQNLKNFRQQYAEISMIFTTRDLGSDDLDIEKKLEMLPLSEAQMRDFVKAYLPEKGEEMLKQLGNRLKELAETPLLLWMLCSVFDDNQNKIPANLGLVFQIFTGIYDKKLKADVPTYQESRDWWRELLQVLAWKMNQGESKTEIQVAISRTEAEEELSKFIKNKGFPEYYSKQWLKDLLKYHLIHLEGNHKIAFRHQLIQEYYTAEELKKKLPHLRDEQLKWDYLNYLKWTEPVALLLGLLDNETQAKRVVKLGLEIDLKLGARLAGEVNFKFQKQTVGLVLGLDVPKWFKVKLLGLTKSNQVVNELSQALEDSDWGVRRSAAEALAEIGTETATAGLLKALEHSDDDVRMRAALALSKIGSETAIAELLKALEHSDDDVRMRAALALSKIGSETAIAELLKALKDSDWYVRGNAAFALGNIGSETAIAGLLKALEDSYSYVRWNAAEALGNIGSETAIPGLLKALEDSDRFVRRNAAEALAKIGSETAIAELLKALEHSDDDDRWNAAEALGKIGSETAIAELLKALEHSDEDVRGNAALALGNIGSEAAIPELLKPLEHPNEYVRGKAAEALGNIGSETAIPGLLKALKDSYFSVRWKAAEALGKIGSKTAMTELIKCLKNPDFVTLNNGDTLSEAREALDTIQNKLKYYHPLSQPMNQQVYISYNWQEDSNEMANQLVQAFAAKGIEIIRDKTHTSYKDSIKNFMRQIGRGKCVVVVISDRYLKSENCMFELVEIARNGDFYQRIFPIILPDARRIHKAIERLQYIRHWEGRIQELENAMHSGGLANLQGITDDLNLYTEIRHRIASLTDILKDMNTLDINLHRQSEFAAMIEAVETKLAEDSQKLSNQSPVKSESKYRRC
ncbi:MAG: TIR domain-containing protein [Microcystis sp. Msp_OC_L_20101000_S702]|uniref:HEAT repeat domain-containing protein n=1 Tax=Microcystis sp. Msp_OC_L_20101000_S702 TaxID=2486218 RepID=UPI001194FF2F|nr:HEAT repeat domain-containing protein [Microcystis sp. Msp_OC_L_20101000_S702]TRU06885.1 MAG: TIR domain-containing protein [Microcystis sp. Msp_OC_L_20101000_S702]